MHSDAHDGDTAVDAGLLSPITVDHDRLVSDAAFAACLVTAEAALARAWAEVGIAPVAAADAIAEALLPAEAANPQDRDEGAEGLSAVVDVAALTREAVAGGNPVIPLVGMLRGLVPEHARVWVHRGATSQDIMDTALMLMSVDAGVQVLTDLAEIVDTLSAFAREHRDETAAARTLTQHAVPTTVGLRAANWARGVERAAIRLDEILVELPAQLGGAGGTLASFAQLGGERAAQALPGVFAELLGLATPDAPWHTQRWPITELGDALVQAIDALGKLAADVATLSRTEIGELAEGTGGGSSAMPQKRNPTGSVLIRSAAIRAPQLGATLHAAAALAADERPDGAWHAEWQTLRELLRLALGAAAHAGTLVRGLRVDREAVRRNLGITRGLILAERLNLELAPLIGADRVKRIVAEAGSGGSLEALIRAEPGLGDIDVAALLDPADYTGLAAQLVDELADDDPEPAAEETP